MIALRKWKLFEDIIQMYKSYLPLIGFLTLIGIGSNSDQFPEKAMDSENPLPACPESPNCIRTSISFSDDSAKVIESVTQALEKMGTFSFEFIESEQKFNSVFRIPVFGWKDDLVILVNVNSDSTTLFIRSSSREGYYDLGVNRRRVKKLNRLLGKTLSSI